MSKTKDKVKVKIENVYMDGHESERTVTVPAPVGSLKDWWENVVFPKTGDGHDCEGDAVYTATIVKGPIQLVGLTREWIG